MSKILECSGRIDEHEHPDAYAAILDAMAAVQEMPRLRAIESAAMNFCRVRGRHHSEMATKRLMDACQQNAERSGAKRPTGMPG